MTHIQLVLGNQLFHPPTELNTAIPIVMVEHRDLCAHFKYHKHKIVMILSAMRHYKNHLERLGYTVFYHHLNDSNATHYFNALETMISNITEITHYEIEDHFFSQTLTEWCNQNHISMNCKSSPLFITSQDEFSTYLSKTKKPFMKTFYEQQRKKLDVLMENGKPKGGQWSFDEENRKKTPKKIEFPNIPTGTQSTHLENVKSLVKTKFNNHIGEMKNIWFPTKRSEVFNWCDNFITVRFNKFGDYEDAIDPRSDFLFHSVLSPFINAGLITPTELLEKIKKVENKIPINSYEGFVRQVIGWREFMRGIYQNYDQRLDNTNFFNHKRKMKKSWYDGSTGLDPLDHAINNAKNFGWSHHIERLMILANIMNLCEINPKQVYKWFMEMFVDSSDWVMAPNVYGMGLFSDGGIFATKPYICGSSYFLKMMHFKKGPWCDVMDGLYWKFIDRHKKFFLKNPRLAMMVRVSEKMNKERKTRIFKAANNFIKQNTNG